MRFSTLLAGVVVTLSSHAHAKEDIHLQWALCDPNPQMILDKLNAKHQSPFKQNPITYYDTAPPTYTQRGLGLRTKFKPGRTVSVVKVRFGERQSSTESTDCVWDRYGDQVSYTCAMQSIVNGTAIWSEDQMSFVEHYKNTAWDDLVAFGPFNNPKWKLKIGGHKAVFDDVQARSLHLMEIELKVPKAKSSRVYDEITRALKEHGVILCEAQESKTIRLFKGLGYDTDVVEKPIENEILGDDEL